MVVALELRSFVTMAVEFEFYTPRWRRESTLCLNAFYKIDVRTTAVELRMNAIDRKGENFLLLEL